MKGEWKRGYCIKMVNPSDEIKILIYVHNIIKSSFNCDFFSFDEHIFIYKMKKEVQYLCPKKCHIRFFHLYRKV